MVSTLVARLRSLLHGARRNDALSDDLSEEFRLHLDLRAADLERSGLSAHDARRQARREFGNIEMHKQGARAARGLHWFDELRFSSLDVKLGFRMLLRYPGLTIVGGIAIAFAIGIGSATFEFLNQVVRPHIPLFEGDRLVGIRTWNAARRRVEQRVQPDFVTWREQLHSVQDLGAFVLTRRNLNTNNALVDREAEPVDVAEISASAFRMAHVPPLLGRALIDADERPGAPDVLVVGYEAWQSRFAGDSSIVGRTVRLGSSTVSIIGVMPRGFKFPISQNYWTPLRFSAEQYARGQGPAMQVFGKLAPGATLERANLELAGIARRAARAYPATNANLRPEVMTYARSLLNSGMNITALLSVNLFLGMLLLVVFSNVALLMFARAATREAEIVVRTALGASRSRIITQLFAEALILGGVGATVGLVASSAALRWALAVLVSTTGGVPFWYGSSLQPATVAYAVLLTLVAAVIAGVVPALKVTTAVDAGLRHVGARGGGFKFGGVWTAVIVSQIALTVAFPVTAFFIRRDGVQLQTLDIGFRSREYLSVRVSTEGDTAAGAASSEIERRLEADPAVTAVTFADQLPATRHPQRRVEVEGGAVLRHALSSADSVNALKVSVATVNADYFDVLGAAPSYGRAFHGGDAGGGSAVVINQSMMQELFGGVNPVGRRIRFVDNEDEDAPPNAPVHPTPWYEIVGVVRDLGMTSGGDPSETGAGVYQVAEPGAMSPRFMIVHVRTAPDAFAPRLRAVAGSVDPNLRLEHPLALNRVADEELATIAFWFRTILGVSAITMLLSLTGIYAVMAFTVARRTREIGIRVALGGTHSNVALAILRRPLIQVGLGILAGELIVVVFSRMVMGSFAVGEVLNLAGYALLMLGVCLCACIVPARRVLAVQPTEALRDDG